MMHHMTSFCKRDMLAFAQGRGNLLSLLHCHHCSALRVARQEQDRTCNAFNCFLPGSARWNKRDVLEHVQIELRLSLEKRKEFFFRPVKCAWGQELARGCNAFFGHLDSERLVPCNPGVVPGSEPWPGLIPLGCGRWLPG